MSLAKGYKTPTNKDIQQAVARAIEVSTAANGGPRLVPFTPAQLRFIQEVVSLTLGDLLAPGRGGP